MYKNLYKCTWNTCDGEQRCCSYFPISLVMVVLSIFDVGQKEVENETGADDKIGEPFQNDEEDGCRR